MSTVQARIERLARSAGARRVLVTGGAGYVGSRLVPALLNDGHYVNVLDLHIYGTSTLRSVAGHPRFLDVAGDVRRPDDVNRALTGCDSVIHLAAISNDPSFELDPALGQAINHAAFLPLVRASRTGGVSRFIYASSASVYGVKDEPSVTEDLPLEPITDYSRCKAQCEAELLSEATTGFACIVVRPATLCGYSPRLRLDLTVNILTNHAVNTGQIRVYGGTQMRPNLHVADMVDLYRLLLLLPAEQVDRRIYNASSGNLTVAEIAQRVRTVVDPALPITVEPTNDPRSYRISAARLARELGFSPALTIDHAIRELVDAFRSGLVPEAMTSSMYYNIRRMQELRLT